MWKNSNLFPLLVRIQDGTNTMEKNLAVPQNVQPRMAIWSSNSTLYPRELEPYGHTKICKQIIHNCIISNSQKVEITHMSINWLTDGRWHEPQEVIPSSRKKEWGIHTCYNMDETSPWSKVRHKRLHTVWFHVYEVFRSGKSQRQMQVSVSKGWGMGSDCLACTGFLWGDGVWKCFESRQRWQLHNTLNILNATELFTWDRLILDDTNLS